MNNTITLTDEQMKALQSGQSITIEPPKQVIQKWEPKGGDYTIYGDFKVERCGMNTESFRLAGMEYQTQFQADSAAKQLRAYARQLAYLAENDDGWIADWSNSSLLKYYVYYNYKSKKFKEGRNFTEQSFGRIYMSKANATKLAQLMNDSIVEF